MGGMLLLSRSIIASLAAAGVTICIPHALKAGNLEKLGALEITAKISE